MQTHCKEIPKLKTVLKKKKSKTKENLRYKNWAIDYHKRGILRRQNLGNTNVAYNRKANIKFLSIKNNKNWQELTWIRGSSQALSINLPRASKQSKWILCTSSAKSWRILQNYF